MKTAQMVHEALALTGTPPASPSGGGAPETIDLDTAQIRQVLGHGGNVSGGVYHVTVPRAETIHAMGVEVPPSMGTATSLNFQPTGGGKAAVNGDFVMTAGEVQKVIAALKQNDRWVHLRPCLTCGYVGHCDSSPNRHAPKHFHATGHPLIQSFEPNEDWSWCYVEEVALASADVRAAIARSREPASPSEEGGEPPDA